MGKLETLVVPEELGRWLKNRSLGSPGRYFTVINELFEHYITVASYPTDNFIHENKKELIEVILGSREYKVEEPKYYALIKGHELIKNKGIWTTKYWNFDTTNGNKLLSNRFTVDGKYLIEMSKSEWNKLGINDSNADFVKV